MSMNRDFVYIDECVSGIRWDAKYATWDNFIGCPVDGYDVNRIVGTRQLAEGLRRAQRVAGELGFGLLLWDGYRPQIAVDCFLRWASSPEDGLTKDKHYPNIEKAEIVEQGYVAKRSGHSRGGTIDLTLFSLETGMLVDMGGRFDYMDVSSHHGAAGITAAESKNRDDLRLIMERSGFLPYELEWWHYTLLDEPYPDTYFDFRIA